MGGNLKGTDKFKPAELFEIASIADPDKQNNLSREVRGNWRNDPASPYNDPAHPQHQAYVDAMQLLYGSETMADTGEPVFNGEK